MVREVETVKKCIKNELLELYGRNIKEVQIEDSFGKVKKSYLLIFSENEELGGYNQCEIRFGRRVVLTEIYRSPNPGNQIKENGVRIARMIVYSKQTMEHIKNYIGLKLGLIMTNKNGIL